MSTKTVKIQSYEKGIYFKNREFCGLLSEGRYWFLNPFTQVRVDIADMRNVWIDNKNLDLIVKSGALQGQAQVLNLRDYERALVWVDGRFDRIVSNGLFVVWTTCREVRVEIVDARQVRFNHSDISQIMKSASAKDLLEEFSVAEDHVGVLFINGKYVENLEAGRYVFWKGVEKVHIFQTQMAEMTLDISGQEIMTSDKVTLRLNAVVAYTVKDAQKAVRFSTDVKQSLYREAQLALRAVVGSRDLDALLADKDALANELKAIVSQRAESFGLTVTSLGIRDIILPGEMKTLLNKVTEAKKASEANLIVRREETAAIRSQVNTAKLLEDNPVLMRLRELEVLEKVSANSKMSVVLGEKGLADRVVNLL